MMNVAIPAQHNDAHSVKAIAYEASKSRIAQTL